MTRTDGQSLKSFDYTLAPKSRHKVADCSLFEMSAQRKVAAFRRRDKENRQ